MSNDPSIAAIDRVAATFLIPICRKIPGYSAIIYPRIQIVSPSPHMSIGSVIAASNSSFFRNSRSPGWFIVAENLIDFTTQNRLTVALIEPGFYEFFCLLQQIHHTKLNKIKPGAFPLRILFSIDWMRSNR